MALTSSTDAVMAKVRDRLKEEIPKLQGECDSSESLSAAIEHLRFSIVEDEFIKAGLGWLFADADGETIVDREMQAFRSLSIELDEVSEEH